MILSCQNVSKAFGTEEILKNVSFHVEEHERVAIVGINGAGKSTLLKIIVNSISADEGEVTIAKNTSIGYLAQYQDVSSEHSIYEEVLLAKEDIIAMEASIREYEEQMKLCAGEELNALMEKYHSLLHIFEEQGGYFYKSEIVGVLKGLGFAESEFDRSCASLSGGQKTRLSLAKLLVKKPDILLLDEPTNHLDLNSIVWLEEFLRNYKGTVILVSHDRYFLDRIVTKVVEVFMHQAYTYAGNYSEFSKLKAKMREAQMRQYLNQQREIAHQEEVITKLRSFNREKSIKRAESRQKALDKIALIEKPVEEDTEIRMTLEPNIVSGKDVLSVDRLAKAFPGTELFSDISFEIKRGERVALIGNNGTGKTTMLKIITGMLAQDAGTIRIGTNVHIGYYDQEQQLLCEDKTLFDELLDAYSNLNQTQIRNVLAAFLFTGEDAFKRVMDLSGGERGRLSLAKLMLSEANFLILDEPTNHLDMASKEILEQALKEYTGTVFFVSHDRYFINQVATRIIELDGQRTINYIGNYDYYLEKRDELKKSALSGGTSCEIPLVLSNETETENGKLDWQEQKKKQARIRKIQSEIRQTEDEIAALEEEKEAIEQQIADPAVACISAKLMEFHTQVTAIDEKLAELYVKWEQLSEEDLS
ncbi:MAG: ABC-F family ATP-binding cassette domain-containing protein [bacterium]|nr:ABC-F family ATP-binding cassette domain-containing protein [bacterium]